MVERIEVSLYRIEQELIATRLCSIDEVLIKTIDVFKINVRSCHNSLIQIPCY